MFYFTELADWLRANNRNRVLFTGPPLRLPGAVGSPATPVATVCSAMCRAIRRGACAARVYAPWAGSDRPVFRAAPCGEHSCEPAPAWQVPGLLLAARDGSHCG